MNGWIDKQKFVLSKPEVLGGKKQHGLGQDPAILPAPPPTPHPRHHWVIPVRA